MYLVTFAFQAIAFVLTFIGVGLISLWKKGKVVAVDSYLANSAIPSLLDCRISSVLPVPLAKDPVQEIL